MIIHRTKKILIIFILIMIASNISNFAAIVSDNDGSAFVTKAEFDALKANFVKQIDDYNSSIDGKIDGAIASYLSGIKLTTTSAEDNLLYKILNNNANYGFYNVSNNTNFALNHKIEFNGINNFYCCYMTTYWRGRENYSGYVTSSALTSAYGSTDAIIPRYKTVGAYKVYLGCWNKFNISYSFSDTNYFTGNDLYLGGVITDLTYSNNNLGVFDPSTLVNSKPYKFSANTKGLNTAAKGGSFNYTPIGYYVPDIGNTQQTTSKTWSPIQVYECVTLNKTPTNVGTSYRYDVSKSELYNNLPLYHTTPTTSINAFDTAKDIDKAESYTTLNLNLTHTVREEFGSGYLISSLGWNEGGKNYITLSANNDAQLYKLNTSSLKLNDLYNYYMYENFGIYVKNTDVYWPLFTTSKNCEISFTLKPNTTAGTLYMYNNVKGSQTLTPQEFTANGGTAATSKSLSTGTTYTIKANVNGEKNIVLKWVPTTNTAGGNSFTTSEKVDIVYEN